MSEDNNVFETMVDTSTKVVDSVIQEQNLSDAFNEKAEANLSNESTVEEVEINEEEIVEKVEEPKEDPKFASRFAALSRKEKEIRQREKQLESRLSELEAKAEKEPKVEVKKEVPLEYRLKKNPLETLSEMGLSYDKLTELALNDGKLTPDMQMQLMRQEIEQQYKQELESLRSEYMQDKEAQEQEKYQQTLNKFVNELTDFVNDSDEFELIKANDGVQLVYDVIEEHYTETGEVLDNATAAKLVEEHYEQELKKLADSKKFKSLLSPKEEIKPEETQRQSPTLSNTMSTQVSTKGVKKLSEDESKTAAAQLLKWD